MERINLCDLGSYNVPPDAVIANRKSFYLMRKKSTESTCEWLNLLQNSIDACEFGQMSDFILTDKFFGELNKQEIHRIGREKEWPVAKLFANIVAGNEKSSVKSSNSSKVQKMQTNDVRIGSVSTLM